MKKSMLMQVAKDYQQKGYFPSCAVSVFDSHRTLCRFTLGEAREDSLFDLASLTKLATATLVFDTIRKNRLTLEERLPALLPWLLQDRELSIQLEDVTIFRLLTHTAGLPAWYPFYTQTDLTSGLKEALKLPRPSGVEYSDIGFILLGKVLEQVWGLPLDQLVNQRLARPLGLLHYGFHPSPEAHILPSGYGNPQEVNMVQDLHTGFAAFRSPQEPIIGQVHDGNAWYAFSGVSGHAGIFSDLDGVQKLGQHYLNTDDALYQTAMTEQAPGRGLGFEVGEMYPQGCGHTGFTGTSLYLSKELQVGCVILTNRCFYKEGELKLTNPFRRQTHQLVAQYFGQPQS